MFLGDLITSDVRVKLIIELFSEVNNNLYVRELTRRVGTEVNAIRRELKRLTKAGIVKKEQRGNRLYYLVKREHPYYYELLSMVAKEIHLGNSLIQNEPHLGKVRLALMSAEFFEGRVSRPDQLDLLLVGDINLPMLEDIVKDATRKIGRDINYTVLKDDEFTNTIARRENFLLSFLISPNILLLGSANKYLAQ
ncbi:MAG: hypothetical protein QG570_191 [Patescibacteria group bacterium]|nr:hypothetical protein [Patescibacteria group bacterium]